MSSIWSHLTFGRQYSAPIDLFHQFTSVLSFDTPEFCTVSQEGWSIQPGPKMYFSRLFPLILGNHHASTWHWKVQYHSIIIIFCKAFLLACRHSKLQLQIQSLSCNRAIIKYLASIPKSRVNRICWYCSTLTKWYHQSSQQKQKKQISSSFFPDQCFSCIPLSLPLALSFQLRYSLRLV